MAEWINSDGLRVRFGNDQAAVPAAGTPTNYGMQHELVIKIVAVDITDVDVAATRLIYKDAGLPQLAQLVRADVYVTTAFTVGAGAASLDIGLFHDDGDGTYTVEDADGFDVDIALTALDSIGATVACDGAYVDGTDDNVPNDSGGRDLYVSTGYQGTTDTDKYTAGAALFVVKYIPITD